MVKQFTDAYIEAAFWSSTDDKDEPLNRNYSRYASFCRLESGEVLAL